MGTRLVVMANAAAHPATLGRSVTVTKGVEVTYVNLEITVAPGDQHAEPDGCGPWDI